MATSYVSTADADTYHTAHGSPAAWLAASDAEKAVAVVMGSEWLDRRFGTSWKGVRATQTQERDWPRNGVNDLDGYAVSAATTPQTVRDAASYMALQYIEHGDLEPDTDSGGNPSAETVKVGAITVSTSYEGGKITERVYSQVERMLLRRGLIYGGDEMVRA